jgi:hypothetical protein
MWFVTGRIQKPPTFRNYVVIQRTAHKRTNRIIIGPSHELTGGGVAQPGCAVPGIIRFGGRGRVRVNRVERVARFMRSKTQARLVIRLEHGRLCRQGRMQGSHGQPDSGQ